MLQIRSVTKSYGSPSALSAPAILGIDLEIREGEFFSLLGPSGCGKTTLLRLISGFEKPTSGTIELAGQRIDPLPPHLRPFNLVFQKYALFPHLGVWDNVAFGPRMKKLSAAEVTKRVDEALALVKMESFADRSIATLSGGQQQRIALARALVNVPKVLLLDEPLSALDLKLRQQMQVELLALQRRLKRTFIFVTHDQDEALTLSDRIAVMNKGVIEQVGTPQEIYEYPKTPFVAQFIGSVNSLEGQVMATQPESITLQIPNSKRPVVVKPSRDGARPLPAAVTGATARVLVRPEKLKLLRSAPGPDQNHWEGILKEVLYQGAVTQFIVQDRDGNSQVTVSLPNSAVTARKTFSAGERVHVAWFPEDCLLMT